MTWSTELRQAVRTLGRRRGFAVLAIGTIALGIAANTAMLSVIRAVLLEPLPFHQSEDLVVIDSRAETGFLVTTSIPDYRD